MMSTASMGEDIPAPGLSTKSLSISPRIHSLDVLRGIAVLAALFVSIWVFGGFGGEQQKELLLRSKGWNYRVFGAIELLFNGKMRGLIALVFGAAMVLFLTRDREASRQPTGDVFIKRQLWLIILGVINAVLLLWTNDLLFHLGVMGILLFPFFRMNVRGLLIASLVVTLIFCGKYYWNYADDKTTYRKYLAVTILEKKFEKDSIDKARKGVAARKDTLTKLQIEEKGAWEGKLASMKLNLKKDDAAVKTLRGGNYWKSWNQLLPQIQNREAAWTYQFGIWDLASMILLGMFLYKINFFTGHFSRNRYLLFGLLCLATGLLLGWFRLYSQQLSLQDYTKYINRFALPHTFFFPIERAAIVLGYVNLVMFFLSLKLFSSIWNGFAAVGKLALTNYLVQTIVCTFFFFGYGMGYYGRLTQFQLYFFVAELIMIQFVFSIIWLKFFNYGPAEWLLRRLSSGKWLPHRMRKPSSNEPTIPILS